MRLSRLTRTIHTCSSQKFKLKRNISRSRTRHRRLSPLFWAGGVLEHAEKASLNPPRSWNNWKIGKTRKLSFSGPFRRVQRCHFGKTSKIVTKVHKSVSLPTKTPEFCSNFTGLWQGFWINNCVWRDLATSARFSICEPLKIPVLSSRFFPLQSFLLFASVNAFSVIQATHQFLALTVARTEKLVCYWQFERTAIGVNITPFYIFCVFVYTKNELI